MTDRASAEGLREALDAVERKMYDGFEPNVHPIIHRYAQEVRAALRDTGPRPDSGIEGIPPGPYTVEHETEQGGMARIWGKPKEEGGWAIPIVAMGQGDIMRALAAHLNALSTPRTETSE